MELGECMYMCGLAMAEEMWWKVGGKSDDEADEEQSTEQYMDGEEDGGDTEYLPPPHVELAMACAELGKV